MCRPARPPWLRAILLAVGGLLVAVALAAAGECYLRALADSTKLAQPNYSALFASHAPYSIKHFHPSFGFFFQPQDSLGSTHDNGAVSISERGFRGPGPEAAGSRKLAFLVGNSVVFGFAPHDSLTITGFLNRLQDRYFFVNAGAPSWVSRQMRDRTISELLFYRPALVVLWGGHNDASLAFSLAAQGRAFEAGSIEEPTMATSGPLRILQYLAPHITARFRSLLSPVLGASAHPVDLAVASIAAEAFVDNVRAAFEASKATGADFLFVYQPSLYHHKRRPPGSVSEDKRDFFDRFRSTALFRAAKDSIPMADLGAMFDAEFEQIPLFRPESGGDLGDHVFVDQVHLYEPGNEMAAQAIVKILFKDAGG